MPGAKRLVHDGRHVLLTAFVDGEALYLALGQDIREGAPFDFVISPGAQMDEAARTVDRHRRFAAGERTPALVVSGRPGRLALLHKGALQAFDGVATGTSQREIARHLYGIESVARDWNPDSELRARVRHLLRRARALVDGGYRDLISKSSPEGR
jgi:hypothetical protein